MPPKRKDEDPTLEVRHLLKKSLVLQLFELSVPQGDIAKKLKVEIRFVNDFLKGIKKPNAKEREEK
jgi:hypothetical protein